MPLPVYYKNYKKSKTHKPNNNPRILIMGCGLSKNEPVREISLGSGPKSNILGYRPTPLGPNEQGDEVVFEEEIWREYYNKQALKEGYKANKR